MLIMHWGRWMGLVLGELFANPAGENREESERVVAGCCGGEFERERTDNLCVRYEASYFKWPGSVEIVGKGREGDNICV